MTVFDFLFFDKKNRYLKWSDALKWMVIPLIYIIFIFLRALFIETGTEGIVVYPYYFIDVDKNGIFRVLINIAGVVIAFIVFSYLMMFLDIVIGKLGKKSK